MNSALYEEWLARETWSLDQAVLLLYGYNPDEWDGPIPKQNSSVIFDKYELEIIQEALHELKMFLMDAFFDIDYYEPAIDSVKVCQWAWVTQKNFYLDKDLLNLLNKQKDTMDKGYECLDWNFEDMAKKDLWCDSEILNAIFYCPRYLGSWHDQDRIGALGKYKSKTFFENYPRNPLREEIYSLMELARKAKVLEVIDSNDNRNPPEYYYKPKQIIEWAKKKEIELPRKLLESLDIFEASQPQKPATQKKYQNTDKARTHPKRVNNLLSKVGKEGVTQQRWKPKKQKLAESIQHIDEMLVEGKNHIEIAKRLHTELGFNRFTNGRDLSETISLKSVQEYVKEHLKEVKRRDAIKGYNS